MARPHVGATPPVDNNIDNVNAITTGNVFTVDSNRTAYSIWFWAPATNTGTYAVGLWEVTDDFDPGPVASTLLTSVTGITAASLTANAWNRIDITPTALDSTKFYMAGRWSSSGRFVRTVGALASAGISNAGINIIQSGSSMGAFSGVVRSGTFNEGVALAFPASVFGQPDYWVEIDDAPGTPTSNDAVIAGSIAGLAGNITGGQRYDTTVSGSVAGLAGSLTGSQTYDTVLSGSMAGIAGNLAGDSVNSSIVAGNMPALAGVVTGDQVSDLILVGSVPPLAGTLTMDQPVSIVDVLLSGTIAGLVGSLAMANDAPVPVIEITAELLMNRKLTLDFIASRPTLVTLVPRDRYRTGTGAWKWQLKPARSPQVMRVIEQGPPEVLTTTDGVVRRVDYVLLAAWDASLAKGDLFTYDGDTVEVIEVYHHNGYEIRASAERKLDPPAGV